MNLAVIAAVAAALAAMFAALFIWMRQEGPRPPNLSAPAAAGDSRIP